MYMGRYPLLACRHTRNPARARNGRSGKQREVRLALAAQNVQVDLDPAEPARLAQHAGLRLDALGHEDPLAVLPARVLADAVEVAGELLDGVDGPDPLDLDRHPAVLLVAAHEIHRADVGRPLAADQAQALAAPLRVVGQKLLQVALDAVLLERGGL